MEEHAPAGKTIIRKLLEKQAENDLSPWHAKYQPTTGTNQQIVQKMVFLPMTRAMEVLARVVSQTATEPPPVLLIKNVKRQNFLKKLPVSCRSTMLLISFKSGCEEGECDFADEDNGDDFSSRGDRSAA